MKKIYTAPEAELLCFRPVETIAAEYSLEMDNLLKDAGQKDPVNPTDSDVIIEW